MVEQVVFVNEIQLEESVRRKGLGKFMMQVLEIVAFKADMRKIMVAVFKQDQLVEKVRAGSLIIQSTKRETHVL